MIRLTDVQREYIRKNIVNLLICADISCCHRRVTARSLMKKNIIDNRYGFTKYFTNKLIELNKINIYGSDNVRFLTFDPVYTKFRECSEKYRDVYNDYMEDKVSKSKHNYWYDKHYILRKETSCIRELIVKHFKKENIYIPTRLHD
jgi:hypothetical protein